MRDPVSVADGEARHNPAVFYDLIKDNDVHVDTLLPEERVSIYILDQYYTAFKPTLTTNRDQTKLDQVVSKMKETP